MDAVLQRLDAIGWADVQRLFNIEDPADWGAVFELRDDGIYRHAFNDDSFRQLTGNEQGALKGNRSGKLLPIPCALQALEAFVDEYGLRDWTVDVQLRWWRRVLDRRGRPKPDDAHASKAPAMDGVALAAPDAAPRAESQPSLATSPSPAPPPPAPTKHTRPPGRKKGSGWFEEAREYVVKVYCKQPGMSGKELHAELLKASQSDGGCPFSTDEKGTSLVLRRNGKPVAFRSIENTMPKIRSAANDPPPS